MPETYWKERALAAEARVAELEKGVVFTPGEARKLRSEENERLRAENRARANQWHVARDRISQLEGQLGRLRKLLKENGPGIRIDTDVIDDVVFGEPIND